MSDLPPIHTHAALERGAIMTMHGTRYSALGTSFEHVTDLATRCMMRGIGALWMLGESGVPLPDSGFCEPRDGWNIFTPQGSNPRSCVVRPAEGTHTHVYLHWLDSKSRWPFRTLTDARAVLDALSTYSRLLRAVPDLSPAQNGLDLLYESITRRTILDRSEPVPMLPSPNALSWLRPFDPERTPFLHRYDTNACYLGVAATQSFGTGAWTEVRGEPAEIDKTFGAWRVTATAGNSPYRGGADLPSPWPTQRHRAEFQGWAYTPQVKQARRLGWDVTVSHGYQWTERHQLMRPWAEKLWAARSAAPAGPVRDAIKAMYTQAFGRMGMNYKDAIPPWYARPQWWGWIVSEGVRKQLSTIDAILRHTGQMPVFVDTDSLVYASADGNPAALAYPRAEGVPVASILARCDKLGGFKHAGTVTDRDAVRDLAAHAEQSNDAGEWLYEFKGAARFEAEVMGV